MTRAREREREDVVDPRGGVVDALDDVRVRPRVSFATYATVRWDRARGGAVTTRDGVFSAPRGPYAQRCDGTAALKRLAFEEGRSIRCDRAMTSGIQATFTCNSPKGTCPYRAKLSQWRGLEGDGRFYITEYVPHDDARCTSTPDLTPGEIVEHPLARAMMACLGEACSSADVADIAREVYGVKISESTAEKARARLRSEIRRGARERRSRGESRERVRRLYSPQSMRVVNCVERSRRPRAAKT